MDKKLSSMPPASEKPIKEASQIPTKSDQPIAAKKVVKEVKGQPELPPEKEVTEKAEPKVTEKPEKEVPPEEAKLEEEEIETEGFTLPPTLSSGTPGEITAGFDTQPLSPEEGKLIGEEEKPYFVSPKETLATGLDLTRIPPPEGLKNRPPIAVDDIRETPEDTPININILANDSDPNSDPLIITGITNNPSHGSVTINPDGTVTYTPDPNYNGSDTFEYEVSDGQGGSNTAIVTVNVTPAADYPNTFDSSITGPE
ncbi:MAG: cadherin-like domain-containing protein, partial [Gammaproteobacteria bacterium]|nr:cadherin-like domain-containing protein [Gammaproteobacteria bacterium]